MKIKSLRDELDNIKAEHEAAMATLVAVSRIGERFSPGDQVITTKPWRWVPLKEADRVHQQKARSPHRAFVAIVRKVLTGQPLPILDSVEKSLEHLSEAVDQVGTFGTRPDFLRHSVDQDFARIMHHVNERALGDLAEPILVPDTSALYWNTKLDEWRFDDLPKFLLVLVPDVLREIDKHKDAPEPSSRKEKAKGLARQIGEYRRRGRWTDGVVLRADRSRIMGRGAEPNRDRLVAELGEGVDVDDRILASVLDIACENPKSPVALVTRDVNQTTKASALYLASLEPPDPHVGGRE